MKKYSIYWLTMVGLAFGQPLSDLETPKLVIFIAVDQLSEEVFRHYEDLYTGGFKWLIDHGVQFNNTHHEHGNTSTGPGHFVLGSGQHPGPVGITGNSWWDRDLKRSVYCVEDQDAEAVLYPGDGFSYRNVNTTGLGDWIKGTYSESRVYSIAGKDRAAVFMGGKTANLALYYNWQGSFITSDYYTDKIPDWLINHNNRLQINSYRDSLWTRTFPTEVCDHYAHQDHFIGETDKYQTDPYSPVFQIGFDKEMSDSDILGNFFNFPWMERATIEAAKEIISHEELGKDDHPDYLFIGLSATDAIHHYYGPYSHEGMDNLIKIDRYLGDFINHVHKNISANDILYVFSADHGGSPLPEHLLAEGYPAGRINRDDREKTYQHIMDQIENKFGNKNLVKRYGSDFYYDLPKLDELKIEAESLDTLIIDHMMTLDGIASVYTNEEIATALPKDQLLTRLRNSFHRTRSPDILVLKNKYWQNRSSYGTGHGTQYDYDSHVPLIISHAAMGSFIDKRPVATVDIAPTIAKMLGVIPEKTDGQSLID